VECQFSVEKVKGQGYQTSKPTQQSGVVFTYVWQIRRRRS